MKNAGYVEEGYINGMLEREKLVSTYLDHNIAIPHGEAEVKEKVKREDVVEVKGWCKFAGETTVGKKYESK